MGKAKRLHMLDLPRGVARGVLAKTSQAFDHVPHVTDRPITARVLYDGQIDYSLFLNDTVLQMKSDQHMLQN